MILGISTLISLAITIALGVATNSFTSAEQPVMRWESYTALEKLCGVSGLITLIMIIMWASRFINNLIN